VKTNLQIGLEQQRAVYFSLPRPLLSQIAQAHGISVRDFAAIFEISKSHAEEIMSHDKMPSLALALKITRYFECTVEEMFGWLLDDTGDRRPLLVEMAGNRLVRLNARNPKHTVFEIAGATAEAMKKRQEVKFRSSEGGNGTSGH
jgi:transcriptional regulator with XRE-family HTH domain